MKQKYDFARRLLATAASFGLFGAGGVFLGQIILPIAKQRDNHQSESEERARQIVSSSFRFFMRFMAKVGVLNFKFIGLEKMQGDEGCLILSNHPSLIDAVALMSIYPKANCIVKQGLWQNPFLRNIVKESGYIKSADGENVLELAEVSVRRGDNLLIFPEGTRTVPGQSMNMKRGAAHLALRLNRPIRLVHISMNPTTLTKAERWYHIPNSKAKMTITIGEKIFPEAFPSRELPPSIRARRLNRIIQEKLENTTL